MHDGELFLAGLLKAYPGLSAKKHLIRQDKNYWRMDRSGMDLYPGDIIIADAVDIEAEAAGLNAGEMLRILDEKHDESLAIASGFTGELKAKYAEFGIVLKSIDARRIFLKNGNVYPNLNVSLNVMTDLLTEEVENHIIAHNEIDLCKFTFGHAKLCDYEDSSWIKTQRKLRSMKDETGLLIDPVLCSALGNQGCINLIKAMRAAPREARLATLQWNTSEIPQFEAERRRSLISLRCEEGLLTSAINLGAAVQSWSSRERLIVSNDGTQKLNGTVRIAGEMPTLVLGAAKGKPLGKLIRHPWLPQDSEIVTAANTDKSFGPTVEIEIDVKIVREKDLSRNCPMGEEVFDSLKSEEN